MSFFFSFSYLERVLLLTRVPASCSPTDGITREPLPSTDGITGNLSSTDGITPYHSEEASSQQAHASSFCRGVQRRASRSSPQRGLRSSNHPPSSPHNTPDPQAPTAAKFSSKRAGGTTFQSMLSPAFHQQARSNISKQI